MQIKLTQEIKQELFEAGIECFAVRHATYPLESYFEPHTPPNKIVINMIKLCQVARKNQLICNLKNKYSYKTIVGDYYQLVQSSL